MELIRSVNSLHWTGQDKLIVRCVLDEFVIRREYIRYEIFILILNLYYYYCRGDHFRLGYLISQMESKCPLLWSVSSILERIPVFRWFTTTTLISSSPCKSHHTDLCHDPNLWVLNRGLLHEESNVDLPLVIRVTAVEVRSRQDLLHEPITIDRNNLHNLRKTHNM